jgi:hypothetical protein
MWEDTRQPNQVLKQIEHRSALRTAPGREIGPVESRPSDDASLHDYRFDHEHSMCGKKAPQLGAQRTQSTRLDLDELTGRLHGIDAEALEKHLATTSRGVSILVFERAVEAGLHRLLP